MPKCVFLFKPSAGENINWGIVFTIQCGNIRLHCSHIIWNYCLKFRSEQSSAVSFAKLPIHSKTLFHFCLFSQLLSCFIVHSFHSLESIPRCTSAIKWAFQQFWDSADNSCHLLWHVFQMTEMKVQVLSGMTGYWWPLLQDKT